MIWSRPDDDPEDKSDDQRLKETHLEHISSKKDFRVVAETFQKTLNSTPRPRAIRRSRGGPPPGRAGRRRTLLASARRGEVQNPFWVPHRISRFSASG